MTTTKHCWKRFKKLELLVIMVKRYCSDYGINMQVSLREVHMCIHYQNRRGMKLIAVKSTTAVPVTVAWCTLLTDF